MLWRKIIFFFLFFVFSCGCGLSRDTVSFEEGQARGVDGASARISNRTENNVLDLSWEYKESKRHKQVDILFVVDTTYHMIKHLKKVYATFRDFLPNLSPSHWKIAFTNADYNPLVFSYYNRASFEGKIMPLELRGRILPYNILYPYFTNSEKVFLDTLKRYEKGDVFGDSNQYINPCDLPPYCQGSVRSPIRSLMKSFSVNKDLFRKYADFVVVIFTNGDDEYVGNNMVNVLFNEFQSYHGPDKRIKIYSISIIPGDQDCFQKDQSSHYSFANSTYSQNIHELVKATGGEAISICEASYSPLAKAIVQAL